MDLRFAVIRLGPGTLYGAITRLEDQGWIRPVQSGDLRQPYTLTPDGKAHLEAQLPSLNRVFRTSIHRNGESVTGRNSMPLARRSAT